MIKLDGLDGPLYVNPKMVTSVRQAHQITLPGYIDVQDQVEISLMGTFVYALGKVDDVLMKLN